MSPISTQAGTSVSFVAVRKCISINLGLASQSFFMRVGAISVLTGPVQDDLRQSVMRESQPFVQRGVRCRSVLERADLL